MSTIRQHRPAFISGHKNDLAEFVGKDELLAIPFVTNFGQQGGFHRFSLWHNEQNTALMAEYHEGQKWFVVGFIEGDAPDLPVWEPKR